MKRLLLMSFMALCLAMLMLFLVFAMPFVQPYDHVYASDLTNADYEGIIYITNNSTATTEVSVPFDLSSTAMLGAGYIDNAFENVAITDGGDVPFMPGYGTNPWCIYVDSIGANATLSYSFYTGNDTLNSHKYWFPYYNGSWGTILDDASLELGANYTLEYYGLFNSSVAGNFLFKQSALFIDISAADTIRMYHSGGGGHDLTAPYTSSGSKQKIEFYQNADSTNMTIEVDDVIIGSMDVGSDAIPNNINNWKILGRGGGYDSAALYLDYLKIYVGGELRGYWYWEYGATFTDHGDDATSCTLTPAFQINSTDADVSAYLGTFEPIDPAEAPATTVQDAPDFLSANITAGGNFTTSGISKLGGPPGAVAIEQIATDSGTPIPWLYGMLAYGTILVSGMGMSYARRRFGLSGGYVLACIGLVVFVYALMIAFGKFDWWMMLFFLVIAGGIGVMSRHIDWGGATAQHSIIGFLAAAWIGLTMINRILEGVFISSAETAWINSVSFTQSFNLINLFTIPIINFSFFTRGIPAMLRWDYSFFGGQAQIIQYMLYSITAVVSFIIFGVILGLVYSAISRSRV